MNQKKQWIALLFIGILLFQGVCAAALAPNTAPSGIAIQDIPTAIEGYVEAHRETTVGMSVAIYDRNGVIYQNGFGFSDKENGVPVDGDTVYDWGSTSKLLLWTGVMQLAEQGKIDLQQDIRTYLPDGFLKNLAFDTPVTMLDLMNHQAGFQETYFIQTPNADAVGTLEEALRSHQPMQIYEPGDVTAYSNWGAALAALIVERVSETDYAEYVHRHIFEPLGMEHTSIGATYQDCAWVKQKREQLVCYDPKGAKIPGKGMYYILIYPAGSAAGTIGDLLRFAQAITPNEKTPCPLFEKQETLAQLYTPTSFYGSSDVANNRHGFFASRYGVETIGHGGNTFGCSTMLQFDPIAGIGMVVMTNQAHEQVYTYDMYELVFGKFTDSELAAIPRSVPQGFVTSARTIKNGPLSLLGSLGVGGFGEEDLKSWWWQEGDRIYGGYFDYEIHTAEVIGDLFLCLLFLLAGVYGFVSVVGGGLCSAIRTIRKKRKGPEIRHAPLRKQNILLCGIMAAIFIDYAIVILRMAIGIITGDIGSVTSYMVQSGIVFALNLLLIGSLLWSIISALQKKPQLSKKEQRKYLATMLLAVCKVLVIDRFDMARFWRL